MIVIRLLLRSTSFGDDQDHPLQKADNSWTYIAADLAYAKNKIERGFNSLIYVLGTNHSSYVRKIQTLVKALGGDKVDCEVKICESVNFIEDGVPVKMSKRSRNFTTVADIINEVGADIIRFMMLTRRNDIMLDFDLQGVKEQTKDNPVFYVQYAHVRGLSIIENCQQILPVAYEKFIKNDFDLSLLETEEEIDLIKLLTSWPKVLEGAGRHLEPHRIPFYLQQIATKFHSLWNLGKEKNDYRFIVVDNTELSAARLALAKALIIIIRLGFEVMGVTPINKM